MIDPSSSEDLNFTYKIRPIEEKHKLSQAIRESLYDSQISHRENPLRKQDEKDRITDRMLKIIYGVCFIGILTLELIAMNAVFILTGLGKLKFSQWSLELYMGGTIAQVFGVVSVITKHLFPIPKK
jgi:hypothetical protein